MKDLYIDVENMNEKTEEEFALLRRNGLGASDMAAVLGAYAKFKTDEDVLAEKLSKIVTDAERAIGEKVNVRKGKDLEPLIISKAESALGIEIRKPTEMYRHKDYTYLTINFDGLTPDNIPVECKYCSTYGDKYYDFGADTNERWKTHANLKLEDQAKHYGIPPYYYVQLQQQIFGAGASHGYLAVLRDKDWTLYIFKVMADPALHQLIIAEGYKFWQRVTRLTNS